MADSKGIITVIGRKKLCKAHAGDITPASDHADRMGETGVLRRMEYQRQRQETKYRYITSC